MAAPTASRSTTTIPTLRQRAGRRLRLDTSAAGGTGSGTFAAVGAGSGIFAGTGGGGGETLSSILVDQAGSAAPEPAHSGQPARAACSSSAVWKRLSGA